MSNISQPLEIIPVEIFVNAYQHKAKSNNLDINCIVEQCSPNDLK